MTISHLTHTKTFDFRTLHSLLCLVTTKRVWMFEMKSSRRPRVLTRHQLRGRWKLYYCFHEMNVCYDKTTSLHVNMSPNLLAHKDLSFFRVQGCFEETVGPKHTVCLHVHLRSHFVAVYKINVVAVSGSAFGFPVLWFQSIMVCGLLLFSKC